MEAAISKKLDVDIVCRVCLVENVELFHIFDEMHKIDGHTFSEILSELTTYKVYRHDQMPHQICGKCLKGAQQAYLFKRQAEKSFRKLLEELPDAADFRKMKQEKEQIGVDQAVQTGQVTMYVCKLCNSKFFEKHKLRDHLITKHGGDNVNKECGICHKEFESFRQLQSHTSRVHAEAIKVECPICKKCFTRRDHMQRHVRNIHKENPHDRLFQVEPGDDDLSNDVIDNVDTKESITLEEPAMSYNALADKSDTENNLIVVKNYEFFEDIEEKQTDDLDPDINCFVSDNAQANDNSNQFLFVESRNMSDSEQSLAGEEIDNNSGDEQQSFLDIDEDQFTWEAQNEESVQPPETQKVTIVREYLDTEKQKRKRKTSDLDTTDNRCLECQRSFSRRCHLLRHMRSHRDLKPHVCIHCSKQFTRSDHLKKHIMGVHGVKKFKCTQCDYACATNDALEKHNALRHGNGEASEHKIHPCEFCGKMFVSKTYLRKHVLMHTDRVYECKNCDMKFKERSVFREHEKTHNQNYLCSMCGESFARKDYLTVHMRRHTGEKPYKCKYCEKAFPRATDLNIHERYHVGHKPNICALCGKGFHRAYNLTIHMRTHNGEKPYKCDQCSKSFTQSNDLKSHIRRHTGERYKCEYCDAAFLQMYALRQHALTVHNVCMESSTGRLQKFAPCTKQTVGQTLPVQSNAISFNQQYLQQLPQASTDIITLSAAVLKDEP